jgi:AhpD family alkylhydroperoxidase
MTTQDQTTSESPTTTGCGTDKSAAAASQGAGTAGGCGQGFLTTHVAPFTAALRSLDEALDAARTVDSKTDELIRFALSIKARSEPCVRKHFDGALAAGASEAEIGYVFALTMREAAGADDCWTQGIISTLANETGSDLGENDSAGCCG